MNSALRLASIGVDGWELEDGVQCHRANPATFKIPPALLRYSIRRGNIVKMTFLISANGEDGIAQERGERMWVVVQRRVGFGKYEGLLDNDPVHTGLLKSGAKVVFEARHIIQIYWKSFFRTL